MRRERGVDDGVDRRLGDDLRDQRIADVGAHELGAAHLPEQVAGRRNDVDAEHPIDLGVRGEAGGEMPTQELADTGDENDGWGTLEQPLPDRDGRR